ncbi:MAG: hypothetical protein PVF58_14120 [Candidatus Methanofastidiosia archaeon]|jgi:hypothetical protein
MTNKIFCDLETCKKEIKNKENYVKLDLQIFVFDKEREKRIPGVFKTYHLHADCAEKVGFWKELQKKGD